MEGSGWRDGMRRGGGGVCVPLGYEHSTSVPRVISDRAKVDQARNKVGQT